MEGLALLIVKQEYFRSRVDIAALRRTDTMRMERRTATQIEEYNIEYKQHKIYNTQIISLTLLAFSEA